jgi:hypothetical protein
MAKPLNVEIIALAYDQDAHGRQPISIELALKAEADTLPEAILRTLGGHAAKVAAARFGVAGPEPVDALRSLLYGVEGEEWPRWLAHLPWDVRDHYRGVVERARAEVEAG